MKGVDQGSWKTHVQVLRLSNKLSLFGLIVPDSTSFVIPILW